MLIFELSSGGVLIFVGRGPRGGLVGGGAVPQAAVQDSYEAVRQPAEGVVVADVAGPETVVEGVGAGEAVSAENAC